MNMKKLNFESWYSNILEAVNTKEPVAVTTDTETKGAKGPEVETDSSSPSFSREEIISDIDTIMTHLSQLGTQVREELENEHILDVNEAGEETAMAKVKDFLFAPKYRSMQKKVNKMKMNALDIQITADNLSGAKDSPEAAKKETLQTKKKTIDAQISALQTAVDDKAKDRGSYVQKVLKSEKIKGQMELVKRASGQEDDPAKKKDLADSMKELQKRFEEEQAAVASLKDKAKDAEPDTKDAEAAKAAKDAEDAKAAKDAEDAKAAQDAKDAEDAKAAQDAKDAEAKKDADGADDATKADREKKNSKEGMLDRYKELLKKAEESGDEAKIKTIKDKIAAVSAKESWQLEGTELGRIFEAELKLLESQYKLNESRYTNTSVADKFRQLLG
jgi:hypothetical protein